MIVNTRSYGQLGNRLFLYSHMIASAEHHGVELANPCFAEYAHLFPATRNDLWCRYPVVNLESSPSLRQRKLLASLTHKVSRGLSTFGFRKWPVTTIRLRGEEEFDLSAKSFGELARNSRHVLLDGWLFRCESLLNSHRDKIQQHFRIDAKKQNRIDQLLKARRNNGDVLIGVHIRQGDYKTFQGGKYFYKTEQYVEMMRRVAKSIAPGRACFLVCGNSVFNPDDFQGLNVIFGTGDMIEDLYSFAETDLLIGPPSTFTAWASFYGNVPLSVMQTATAVIDVSRFHRRIAA